MNMLDPSLKKYKRKSDWENILVGNTYNWLTVISIEQNFLNGKRRGYSAVCKCKCGNIARVNPNDLYRGSVYSCGCYRKSKEFINSQHTWQSDKDKFEKSKQKNRQFYIDHPEMISYLSDKNKQYWADHPDIVKSRAEKHHLYYTNHPECRATISRKRKQYFIDNPNKRVELGDTLRQYYKDHPEKVAEATAKYMYWYNSNPDEVAQMIANQRKWRDDPDKVDQWINNRKRTLSDNPNIQKQAKKKFKSWSVKRRKRFISNVSSNKDNDFSKLLNVIHPYYIGLLLSGNLKACDIIKTKCPVCGEYSDHTFNNIFTLGKGKFKYGHSLMCDRCNKALVHSAYEDDIRSFISTFYSGECILNSRKVITPLELDLYYPEKKIAIEFNGDYWHSEEFKSKDYHYNKFMQCKALGITLVSIFEHSWNSIRDDIKGYLVDLFNNKANKLSYVDSNTMNNNYPLYNSTTIDYIVDCYPLKDTDKLVYTCGFSNICR